MIEDQMYNAAEQREAFSAFRDSLMAYFAAHSKPWERLVDIYKRDLAKQQEENVRLLQENAKLRFRIAEMERGADEK